MHIFISYAKVDTYDLAIQLRDELRKIADVTVWMDETLEPGESWALQIQQEIDTADYVIVLLSPDVNRLVVGKQRRSFVLNEIDYAQQEHKTIIPVMAKASRIPVQLAGVQYIDFTKDQTKGIANLIRKIVPETNIHTPIAATSTKVSQSGVEKRNKISPFALTLNRGLILIIILAVATILFLLIPLLNPASNGVPTSASLATSNTSEPSIVTTTLAPTMTNTSAPTLTPTPSLEIGFIVQTLDSQATVEQATKNAQSTGVARATAYAIGTQSIIDQTATATHWTVTPTPNITASIEAYRTQQAATATANFVIGLTATATLWTSTPTSTLTPTDTLTPTRTFTPTITPSPTSTLTLTPTPIPLGFPGNPVTRNEDWKPVFQTFDGFEMALVPVGCFMMGSENGSDDEKPINQQCFDQPFWIDRYEITNEKYGSEGKFKGDNLPRDSVTWFNAHDFCVQRGARLLSEREWEYAARGPSNLVYPWGNEFVEDNVVYSGNSNTQMADVGSQPSGNSWIGASDLSGNVWEWISTIYQPYPYRTDDGRELDSDNKDVRRIVRGGSWFSTVTLIRGAARSSRIAAYDYNDIGFRCARSYET